MRQSKIRRLTRYQLVLTVILLLVCIILLVGATLARYQSDEVSYLNYAARVPDSISLWTDYDAQTGGLTSGDTTWTFTDTSGSLAFYISNGTPTSYAKESQNVSVRLLASLSMLENINNMQVNLSISQNGETAKVWTAIPVQIKEGTSLYKTFGGGQAYIFQDETGTELSWPLDGGSFSILPAQLEITGLSQPQHAALLQLQVAGK